MRSGSRSDVATRLLLVDQDPPSSRMTKQTLAPCLPQGAQIVSAGSGREGIDTLRRAGFDIVLLDLASIKDLSGTVEDAVTRFAKLADGALVIVLSDGASVSGAVAAMRAGAHDFIAKPISAPAFASRVAELAQRHGKARALAIDTAPTEASADFAGFVGASSQMQYVYEQIDRIAPSTAPVFITGESGTGKEVCAQALHRRSQRQSAPFIAINCAAIPRELMEAELFGAARGAYTGAHQDRQGAAEAAHGGTLFLDEIGDMDLALQSKLLRFLQTGSVTRIGEASARAVDVRVICATNRNPMQLIAEKKFREDLFYRLHVLPIHLPPLRQRPADIMTLARHFLTRYARDEGKSFAGFCPDVADLFVAREWPGNVRQLQNLVRRMVVLFDGGSIDAAMVAAADIESRELVREEPQAFNAFKRGPVLPMWQQEQRIIEDAVQVFNGNIALAAAALQISPSTIYRKRQGWAELAGTRAGAA